MASAPQPKIRAYAGNTFMTIIIGAVISIIIGFIVWVAIFIILGYLPIRRFSDVAFYLRNILSLIGGVGAGYAFFQAAKRYEIQPGYRAYLKILGIPFGKLGVGYAWIPWGVEIRILPIQAVEDVDNSTHEYLTKAGIEVFIKSKSTYFIEDPLRTEGIQGSSIPGYIHSVRQATVREWIAEEDITLSPLNTAATADEQRNFFTLFTRMKGDINTNGPSKVRDLMNEKLESFGLQVTQVQFAEVLFNDRMEKAAERVFDELLEGPGLLRDAANKNAVAATIVDAILANAGITDKTQISREELLKMYDKAFARAMAMENQGGYNYTELGGNTPSGVFVNTQTAQQQGGTNP